MAEKKEKRYVSDNAQLMVEWNWEKNSEIGVDPAQLSLGSHKKTWWKCSKEHEWMSAIKDRVCGNGCPYCSGKYVIKGETDLQAVNPTLANEWNYEKNEKLTPMDVSQYSDKKVWWTCAQGHEWEATISNRTIGRGCPYCSGKKVLEGYNDLKTIAPKIAKEWNYEKNSTLKPESVAAHSNKRVWWKCSKGHEWKVSINDRCNGTGCPICSSERKTSFPEYVIIYYLKKYGLEVIHSYKEKGYELDVYIPSSKIAIEYDGYFWHKSRKKEDLEKNEKCERDGIKLYRIRERLSSLNDSSIDYVIQHQEDFADILKIILNEITKVDIEIDIENDSIAIENLREHTEKEISLLFSNPQIAKEWNWAKNGNLKPENFATNSHKKVWWICDKGHEWQANIYNRNNGNGCPYCASNMLLKGYNDLQTINPNLAKEWDYENNILTPSEVMPNSNKKVWWQCGKGHKWQASVISRNNGVGCPYCSSNKLLKGFNDLQTINSLLAKEWNYKKNILTPSEVMPNSNKKVWWICSKGHEWQARIQNRNRGCGCPECAKQKRKKKGT